jgi:KUP system potassium uptake protein
VVPLGPAQARPQALLRAALATSGSALNTIPPSRGSAAAQGAGGAPGTAAAALTLGALGIVFGDIGTSPLYAMSSIFAVPGVRPDAASVDGMISLVIWAIVLVVSVKYVTFVMGADNRGEGGIMALVALVLGLRLKGRAGKAALVSLGIFGVALFFGDGAITPAISVIASVEGLGPAQPGLKSFVLAATLTLLTVLFAGQRFGTRALGRLFGPAMALWFAILAASGLAKVIGNPVILKALSPGYGLAFFLGHPLTGFLALGGIVLAVTGAEALYVDLGQFSRPPITRAWILVVFPALTVNYLGQRALILRSPKVTTDLFSEMFPRWAQLRWSGSR